MRGRVGLILLAAAALPGAAAAVRGRVLDATTREPVAKVSIRVTSPAAAGATTDAQGRFEIDAAEAVDVQLACVGYRPLTLRLDPAQDTEILIVPDTLRQRESLDVSAGPYAVEGTAALSLAGNELRNLASVLADDPLRAVQGLPGVNANDDFSSQLSLRGAGFQRVGIYVDGILLHSPYHTLQADPSAASLTILSSDLLDTAVLHLGPLPAPFGDRTAAALDLRLRDGDRKKINFRASASASNASIVLDGPLSAARRGSWLVSARKSYLQYIINASSDEPSIAFGFSDVQGRVTRDLGRGHALTMGLIDGRSGLDRSGAETQVGINTMFYSDYHYTLGSLQSRWTPRGSVLIQNTAAWMREKYRNRNRADDPLAGGHYGEWIWNSDNRWQWSERASLLFGASLRRLRDGGFFDRRSTAAPFVQRLDEFAGTGVRSGAHVGQHFDFASGRLQFRLGARLDHHSVRDGAAASPNAAVTVYAHPTTQVHFAWGQAVQFPELSQIYSRFGRRTLLPERAIHYQLSVEQRIGERTRLRAEAYQRLDRDLLFRPLLEPRLLPGGAVFGGNLAAPILNSERGYGRGMQFFVQRRAANGLTGWFSYAWSVARVRDGALGHSFPTDFDQRHTANVFLSYRLRPTVNLSSRWVYGSGFPVRGFFRGANPFFLAAGRNAIRIPEHHRLDGRVNKTFVRKGWQWTLFAEVINLYNRDNVRFDGLNGFDARTQVARLGFDKMFQVLPSAGIAIER